jgi:hypothetical protein
MTLNGKSRLKSLDKQTSLRVDYSIDPEEVLVLSSPAMRRQIYGPTGAPAKRY